MESILLDRAKAKFMKYGDPVVLNEYERSK